MCGIAGYVGLDGDRPAEPQVLEAMCSALTHRGPDADGYHISDPVGLGVRRLRVIDLETGDMPIAGCDDRIVVVQNGEIYNFRELRAELTERGHRFRTQSDTEVLVHLYEEYGDGFLEHLNGMFAIGLWDGGRRRLLLARDRLGIKPLHIARVGSSLVFASELKGLLPFPGVERRLDVSALALYLVHEYVPAPWSIYEGIGKLRPGERLVAEAGEIRRELYWQPPAPVSRRAPSPPPTAAEAAERACALLDDAVRIRLVSDVPLGVFLSGGIDSTSVAAAAAAAGSNLTTFAVGFEDPSFDESAWARRAADWLGATHHEEVLTAATLLGLIPEMSQTLDEPFADPSLVPSFLLSRFTRQHVTVALGGDGGDELFLGYPTYKAHRIADRMRVLPAAIRERALPALVRQLPVSTRNLSFDFLAKRFVRGLGFGPAERHLAWMGSLLSREAAELLTPALTAVEPLAAVHDRRPDHGWDDDGVATAQILDTTLYLPDDLLVKVDRASMASSLEVRVPFLDHRLVEYALALPIGLRMPGLQTKQLLKMAMAGRIPDEVIRRKKKGFGIPVGRWLKRELQPLVDELLEPGRLDRQGLFRSETVTQWIAEHRAGRHDHRKPLWGLLMFQLWWERWGPTASLR